MAKNRDGHKIRIILEDQQCRPFVICPHIDKVADESMMCAETVDGKVTGCWVVTAVNDIRWELFEYKNPIEIKQAPFEIEWWIEGTHENAELWVSVIEDDNNAEYHST